LSFETITECSIKLLSENGALWIILPPHQHQKFAFAATPLLLNCSKRIEISHNEGDSPSLIVSKWERNSQCSTQAFEQISIFNHQKQYSDKFKLITKNFYPFL
jgi:tRNA1(Val) A37 N6-methylase TrmN6